MYRGFPEDTKFEVMAFLTSGIIPIAEISKVGGIDFVSPVSVTYSLYRLSLPEISGVSKPLAPFAFSVPSPRGAAYSPLLHLYRFLLAT